MEPHCQVPDVVAEVAHAEGAAAAAEWAATTGGRADDDPDADANADANASTGAGAGADTAPAQPAAATGLIHICSTAAIFKHALSDTTGC